jgi:hypothetical protein
MSAQKNNPYEFNLLNRSKGKKRRVSFELIASHKVKEPAKVIHI